MSKGGRSGGGARGTPLVMGTLNEVQMIVIQNRAQSRKCSGLGGPLNRVPRKLLGAYSAFNP
jgi:hypothetical protein